MRKFVGILALTLALSGCGGSVDDSLASPPVPAQPGELTGKVVSQDGTGLSGVRMILQERTTRQETEVTSGDQGEFTASVAAGVYDVGLDLEGVPGFATAFYGPVVVDGARPRDFVLPDAGGKPAGVVFGTIFSKPGIPAARRAVVARPGFVAGGSNGIDAPPGEGEVQPTSAITDDDGHFSIDLNSAAEVGLDLEVSDAHGELDEFIDVGKLRKPLYLELSVEESSVENQHRVNERSPENSRLPADQLFLSAQAAAQQTFSVFKATYTFQDALASTWSGWDMVEGNIPLDIGWNTLSALSGFSLDHPIGSNDRVIVESKGFLWWDNSVSVDTTNISEWKFSDATGDTYHLLVANPRSGYHFVSYNSEAPSIVALKVEYRLSKFVDGAGNE